MKPQCNLLTILIGIAAAMTTVSLNANVVWPALIIGGAIWSTWFVIIISIIIEAFVLKHFIPALTYAKAFIVSLVGNAASAVVGTIVTAIAMLGWHFVFDLLVGGTFNRVSYFITLAVMFIGSAVIEYGAIRLIFGLKSKQVWIAILVGNLVTYLLVALYNYSDTYDIIKNIITS